VKQLVFTFLLVSSVLSGTTSPVWGQEALAPSTANPTTKSQIYDADYFTQFAPQTAADMVVRLPGFEIRGDEEEDTRGFGQASLNILINGRRPSTKSSDADQILGRIPASNVTQIEIIDGASLDIPGLSGQVANIIAKTGELSGSWNYAARFEKGSQPQLGDGAINFSAKSGRLEAVGSVNFDQFIFTEDGDETFFDNAGNITQDRLEKLTFNNDRPRANLNLTLTRDNGDIGNLNLTGSRLNRNISVSELFSDRLDNTLSGASRIDNGTDQDSFEVGGDYSFDFPALGRNGRLKLIALQRTDLLDFTSRFLFDDGSPGQIQQVFIRDDVATEYIGRAEYTWSAGENSDWSASLEGSLNLLDSDTEITVNQGSPILDAVKVEEERIQANLSRSWAPNDRINLQASIGAEYSVIEVVSENLPSRDLFRPKGLLNASYKLNDEWTLRGGIERRVGQLDFDTFVSTVSLVEGTANQGNDNIVPDQSWETELELQRQNPTGLSGRAKVFYNIIEDRIEQLPFLNADGTISNGPGNLDSNAEVYGAEVNLTWVLNDVLKGLRLTANGVLADSTLEDPITFENRATNSQTLWSYDLQARWDIDGTPLALEAQIEQVKQANFYRIDEVLQQDFIRPEAMLSLTHKNLLGMQWTLKVQNIVDFEFRRQRFVYDGTRNDDLIRHELTRRKRGQRLSIEITDTF